MDEQKEVFHSKKKTFAAEMILTFMLCGKLICLFYALEFFPTCPSYKSWVGMFVLNELYAIQTFCARMGDPIVYFFSFHKAKQILMYICQD